MPHIPARQPITDVTDIYSIASLDTALWLVECIHEELHHLVAMA